MWKIFGSKKGTFGAGFSACVWFSGFGKRDPVTEPAIKSGIWGGLGNPRALVWIRETLHQRRHRWELPHTRSLERLFKGKQAPPTAHLHWPSVAPNWPSAGTGVSPGPEGNPGDLVRGKSGRERRRWEETPKKWRWHIWASGCAPSYAPRSIKAFTWICKGLLCLYVCMYINTLHWYWSSDNRVTVVTLCHTIS